MIEIRPVQPSDAAEWLRLRMALWPDSTPENESGEIARFFANPPAPAYSELLAVFVAVRPDGSLAGHSEVGIHREAPACTTDWVGYLEAWYVDPDLRGTGVGARLAQAAEEWACTNGCTEMASDTNPSYPLSPGAHAALGYAEVSRYFRKELG